MGCHALLQGVFPTPGLNPGLLHLPALAGKFFTTSAPGKPSSYILKYPRFPSSKIFSPHFYTYLSPDTSIPRYRSSPDQSPGLRHSCGASPEGPHLRDQRCVKRPQGHSGAPLLLPFPVFLNFSTTQLSPSLSLPFHHISPTPLESTLPFTTTTSVVCKTHSTSPPTTEGSSSLGSPPLASSLCSPFFTQ